ncbi:MAG: site-specific integrase [Gammaproteobacteria bacterium]
MLRLPSYLQKRADLYYFRFVVPEALRPYWPSREVKHSLKTPDRAHAIRGARALVLYLEGLFEAVSMGKLTHIEAKRLLDEFLRTELAKLTGYLEDHGPLSFEQKERVKESIKTMRSLANFDVPSTYARNAADRVIHDHKLEVEKDTPEYERLALLATHMSITLFEAFVAKSEEFKSFAVPTRTQPASSPAPEVIADDEESILLSKLIDNYCEEKRREGSWTEKTAYSNQGMYDLLLKIVGDVPIKRLDAVAARRYKTILQKLPANLEKSPHYRDLPLHDVLAMKPKDLMSVTTLNNHLTKVASLFGWAERNGYIERNYFANLTMRNPQRPDEARAAFTNEDLKKIFSTGQYKEHKFLHPHYYWLPLLGLHTGARLNELCQLQLSDVRQEDGVWVFDINGMGPGKHLKSKAARRLIPVHPKLLELGFLRFVEQLRAQGKTQLFPELRARRDGAGQSASLWFGRYRKSLGFYKQTPKKDFHSFRTTLINTLKQKGLSQPEVAALVGHSMDSITFDRYGKPYNPMLLLEVLKKVDFSNALGNVKQWHEE